MNIFTKADRVPACDVSNENEADPLRTSLMIQWLFAPHLEVDLCGKSGIDLTSKCRWCRLAVGWLVWFLPTPFLHSEVLLTSATYRAPLSMPSTDMCGARCSLGPRYWSDLGPISGNMPDPRVQILSPYLNRSTHG